MTIYEQIFARHLSGPLESRASAAPSARDRRARRRSRSSPRRRDDERHRVRRVRGVRAETPSASSICSALPWSAVTRQTPPSSVTRSTTRPRQRSAVSTASTTAGIDAGVADHVGVREVDDAEARSRRRSRATEALGHLVGRHLRLVVVARHVARARDEDPRLARPRLLAPAVEEVGHVGVLLGLGDVQLPQPVLARAPRRACPGRSAPRTTTGLSRSLA